MLFAMPFVILKVAFVTTLVGVAVGTALYETHPPFRTWVDDRVSEFQKKTSPMEADSDDSDDEDEKTREARSWELNHRTGRFGDDEDDYENTKENYNEKAHMDRSSPSFSSARSAVNGATTTGTAADAEGGLLRHRNNAGFHSGSTFANPFADESAVLFDQDADTLTSNTSAHTRETSPARDSRFATPSSHRFGSSRRLTSSTRSASTASTISHLPRTVASSHAGADSDDEPASVAESLRQNPLMAALNSSNEDIFVEHVNGNDTDAEPTDPTANTARWVRGQDALSDWDVQSQASGFSESVSRDYDFLSSPEDGDNAVPASAPAPGYESMNGSRPDLDQPTRPASPSAESVASTSTIARSSQSVSSGFDVLSGVSTPGSAPLTAEARIRARERLRLLHQENGSPPSDTDSTTSWDALSGEDGLEEAR